MKTVLAPLTSTVQLFFQYETKIEIKLSYLFLTEFMEMMVCIFPVFSYKLFTIDVDY